MTALLTAIVLWLSVHFDLPANYEHPRVELIPAKSIGALHYGSFMTLRGAGKAGDAAAQAAAEKHMHNVVAVYSNETRTIYLPEGWTGRTAEELSVLVHEMVHHLQNVSGAKFACPQEREKLAFAAQRQWLKLFDTTLEEAFGIDPFSLLVRTNCAY